MGVVPFEASLPRDLARLRGLRQDLRRWLDAIGVPTEQREAVVLAVHEASANAIEHAGAGVLVKGARDRDKLILFVSNEGRWTGSRPSEELERGRGLTLMQALMSNLEISRRSGHTTIRMRLELGAAEEP